MSLTANLRLRLAPNRQRKRRYRHGHSECSPNRGNQNTASGGREPPRDVRRGAQPPRWDGAAHGSSPARKSGVHWSQHQRTLGAIRADKGASLEPGGASVSASHGHALGRGTCPDVKSGFWGGSATGSAPWSDGTERLSDGVNSPLPLPSCSTGQQEHCSDVSRETSFRYCCATRAVRGADHGEHRPASLPAMVGHLHHNRARNIISVGNPCGVATLAYRG